MILKIIGSSWLYNQSHLFEQAACFKMSFRHDRNCLKKGYEKIAKLNIKVIKDESNFA